MNFGHGELGLGAWPSAKSKPVAEYCTVLSVSTPSAFDAPLMTAVASCAEGAAAASTSPTISPSPARLFLTIDHRLSVPPSLGPMLASFGEAGAHCKPLRTGRIEYRLRPMTEFKPQQIDKKWQQQWAASKAFEVDVDGRQYRPHERAVAASGHQLRLGARDHDVSAGLLQVQPVDLPEDARARAGIPQALDRQLVSRRQHRPGQRAGHRRRLLAVRV